MFRYGHPAGLRFVPVSRDARNETSERTSPHGTVVAVQLPVTGHPLHTRSLTVVFTQRDDGRVRVRGDVNDLRKSGFVPMPSGLQPAGIVHQMSIDLDVDSETRRIESIETAQPFVAVEPSAWSGGECCRDPAPRLQALVGEVLDAGFTKRLAAVFGGPRGCSHLLTLFQLMTSIVPRALDRESALQRALDAPRPCGERFFWRSLFLDGHEASDGTIELAVQLHDFHGRPDLGSKGGLERFERHDEVRLFAAVRLPSLAIREMRAAERMRDRRTLSTAAWTSHDAVVASLVGQPILPGLASRIFGALPDARGTEGLRDALLQLAPGYIQVMAAITERLFRPADEDGAAGDGPTQAAAPPVGGMVDSCYVWRADGALARGAWKRPA